MQFGSTEKEPELTPELEQEKMAKKVSKNAATFAGMNVELQIQKQRMEQLWERQRNMEGLMNTLIHEVRQLKELHAKNLSAILNGGPTE